MRQARRQLLYSWGASPGRSRDLSNPAMTDPSSQLSDNSMSLAAYAWTPTVGRQGAGVAVKQECAPAARIAPLRSAIF